MNSNLCGHLPRDPGGAATTALQANRPGELFGQVEPASHCRQQGPAALPGQGGIGEINRDARGLRNYLLLTEPHA
jgi:hypothetical protein